MTAIRVLELRSIVGSGGGPEKTILQGTARSDRSAFAITVCYLRDTRDEGYDLGQRAEALGVDYVEIPERHSFDWRIWPKLVALCRTRSIDIVHSHEYKSDLLAWLLWRRTGARPLATAHGWTGHSWKERRVYYPADKRLLTRFPRVIAVSSDVRGDLLRAGARPSHVTVVLNGIEADRFVRRPELADAARAQFGIPTGAFVVGGIGRLEPQKRFDLLLEAIHQLRATEPRLFVVIAGTGSLASALEAQARRLGLEGKCLLLGLCRDIPMLHHALDLFVQASDYEGTSNAVLEAMAMETPVIATDAGGTAELIRDGLDGLIVPTGSAEPIARAIQRLARDDTFRSAIRASARRQVEGPLSFSARMASVEQVYREIAGQGVPLHA